MSPLVPVKVETPEGKAATGCLPSPPGLAGSPLWNYRKTSSIYGDNESLVLEDSTTGKSWSPSPRKLDYLESNEILDPLSMPNCLEASLPEATFGKKTPGLKERR